MDLPPLHNLTIFLHWKEPKINTLKQLALISLPPATIESDSFQIMHLFLESLPTFIFKPKLSAFITFSMETAPIITNLSPYLIFLSILMCSWNSSSTWILVYSFSICFTIAPQFPSTYSTLLKICPWLDCPHVLASWVVWFTSKASTLTHPLITLASTSPA